MDQFYLRDITEADLPAVAELLRGAFEEYRGWLDPPSGAHDETAENLQVVLRDSGAVLALEGAAIVGCVFYSPFGEHIDLFRLAVAPAWRRRGIGHALIAEVEARTLAQGLRRVMLGVRVALPDNRAYYERLGYRFLAERCHPGYRQATYVLLEKVLDPIAG